MISRRDALKWSAVSGLGAVLTGCGTEDAPEPTATPEPTEVPPAMGTPIGSIELEREIGYTHDLAVRTFQGDLGRTGNMPGPGPHLGLPIISRWKYDLKERGTTPPIVVDDQLYITIGRDIVALASATGEEVWRFSTGETVYCTPSIASDVLYVGSNDNYLYAIDAKTGDGIWKARLGDAIHGSPAVVNGIVFATIIGNGRITEGSSSRGAEGVLYALDAATGREQWRYKMVGLCYCAPAIYGKTLITTCTEGYTYAINAETGEEQWRHTSGSGSRITAATVAAGVVYTSVGDPNLYALNLPNGEEIWRFSTGDGIRSTPTVSGGVVYVGNNSGTTYAIDSRTGREKWRNQQDNFYTNYSVSVVSGTVYQGVRALHANSGEWVQGYEYQSVTSLTSSPNASQSVVNGFVYVVTSDYLIAFSNLKPTLIVTTTVLRGGPSNSGVRYKEVNVGTEVTSIISREEANGETWANVTIDGESGWIPLDAIDPSTIPPDGPIEYLYVPPIGMRPTPTPVPTPTPKLTPFAGFKNGDIVITTDEIELRARAGYEWAPIATLPVGTELKIVGGPMDSDSQEWYEVTILSDKRGGYLPDIVLKLK